MEAFAIALLLAPGIAYLAYPLVLIGAGLFATRHVGQGGRVQDTLSPHTLSIVICAYNEAPRIGAKLETVVAAVAAWRGQAEILVGDDGSSDGTAAVVAQFADRGVTLVRAPRGGKAATMARVLAQARGEIVVMTDADPLFDTATLPELIAPFADPQVGAVAGSVETIRAKRGGRFAGADMLFRRYESAMRTAEDRLFGCVSADGGLYAIRADLVPAVPADVTDDFWISTAAVAAGRRIAFAPRARVYEHSIAGDRQNFRRRVRITVRGMTGLWRRRALMNPVRTGWYAVALVLHKLARRVAPLALPPLWLASGVLAARGEAFWMLVFAGLSAAGLLGAAGYWLPVRLPRALAAPYAAVLHFAGLATGCLLFATGRRYRQWTPQKDAA